MPGSIGDHEPPPLPLRKRPAVVITHRVAGVVGSVAKAVTKRVEIPWLRRCQVWPPSALWKTPPGETWKAEMLAVPA